MGYDVIYVTCKFEKINMDIVFSFDKDDHIAGLAITPSKQAAEESKNDVKAPEGVTETTVTVGGGEWALPGTLSIPKGEGPFPVVILVHGSGANDRDETIGPNKPFRDIAWGLASKGIAVLRYDKRNFVYGEKIKSLIKEPTVKDETIDDATAAVALMRNTDKIDKNRIYVLGHSLGGMLIPRIAAQTPGAAGYIVMAGATRPLEDLVLDQIKYLLPLQAGLTQSQMDETLKQTIAQVNDVKNLKPGDSLGSNGLLGLPASYWLDLKDYKPAVMAKSIKKPMLILQGERDYQVTMRDFNVWKLNLSKNKNVTFKTYKDLNHLFITGQGKSVPAEYEKEGHVSQNMIDDIYNWIKK
jgi:dipeptidyl aminopeptidase/acylaminoacyl peptidase